jgi:hypothetical protein
VEGGLPQDEFLYRHEKTIGWASDAVGRRKRLYDEPRTPFERLLDADVLSVEQIQEIISLHDSLNPALLTREILRLQFYPGRLGQDKNPIT